MPDTQSPHTLQESEARYRALADATFESVVFTKRGIIVDANQQLTKLLGYRMNELRGMHAGKFIVAEDRQHALDSIRAKKETFEISCLRKDGALIDVEIRTRMISFKGESMKVSAIRDITERKAAEAAEAALKLSQTRYEEAQRIAHLGHWTLDLITNDLIWSDENYRIFGAEPGSANTYETFMETVHPDDRELVNLAYTGSVTNRTKYDIEHRLLMGDGSIKWVHEQCETYYDDMDNPLRSIGTTLDITKRKQAEQALRESEEKYSTLIEGANDGIAIVQDMQFKFCNRAMTEITGYSSDELQDMGYLTLIDAEFREMVSERYRQRLAGGSPPDHYMMRFVCKNGTRKEMEASSIRRSRYEGRPAITLVYRDITLQKRAQDDVTRLFKENRNLSKQLMQSQEDERRYIARELHDELGQSLTAIDTASRLIALRSKEQGAIEKAEEIGHITGKLFKDVRSMLVKIRPPMLDSLGLSASLHSLTSHWMQESGIVCNLNITGKPDDFPDIVNIAIYRVLQESLTNISRHAMADQVGVTLKRVAWSSTTHDSDEMLKLDIRDNGKGIDLNAANIMGLGMVGMRERVHVLGGSCSFDSAPGTGVHISVLIPRSCG